MRVDILPFTQIVYKDGKEHMEALVRDLARNIWKSELLSVAHGYRKCATFHIASQRCYEDLDLLNEFGLIFKPIQKCRQVSGFAHRFYEPSPSEPYNIYGVVAKREEDAAEFVKASRVNNHIEIGKLLGYPDCCIAFFSDFWAEKAVDPPFLEAINTEGAELVEETEVKIVNVKGFPECNTMLRYFGLRVVPHLPCSFKCQKSKEFASLFSEFIERREELIFLLSSPLEWNCYRGVAIVENEWFYGITNAEPSYLDRRIVKWTGESYAGRGRWKEI